MAEEIRAANGSLEHSGVNNGATMAPPVQQVADGCDSPPAPQTPSDATSGISEEQNLPASDFFFVTYPFDSDLTGLVDAAPCPCGEDCQCIGCKIHNSSGDAAVSEASVPKEGK
jgi:hypothetical protein